MSDKKGAETIQALIKWGKLDEEVVLYLDYVHLSEIFGWTPKQINEQDPRMLKIYKTILSERKNVVSRKEKNELKQFG